MKFRVTVRNTDGGEEKRTIEAESRVGVYEQVEADGLSVVELEEGTGGTLPAWMNLQFGSGIKADDKITFTKNLGAMLSAGLTLSRALSVIEKQSTNKYLKKVVVDLENSVKSGKAFHEALSDHTKVFSKLFISMTKAGEESGTLAESLRTVAKQMDKTRTLEKKVKGAMIYPSIILCAIVIIGVLMMVYVVPTLSATFADLGAELPLATQIIVGLSEWMVANVILVFILLGAFFGGGYLFFKSKTGSALLLAVSLRVPVIGELVRETMSARASRTLASLLSSGVEMLSAISIAREVVGENVFGDVLVEAEESVRKGEALSASFSKHSKLYPVFVGDMITVGEETGKVADMLQQVAEYYETDVEDRTKDLSTIIEPLLMLFIGAFVGVFAISMIAPIYSLSSSI